MLNIMLLFSALFALFVGVIFPNPKAGAMACVFMSGFCFALALLRYVFG